MHKETKKLLESFFDSCCPIIYICHSDFSDVDEALRGMADSRDRVLEFNNALGAVDFEDKHPLDSEGEPQSLEKFLSLNMDEGFEENEERHKLVLVLKDVHESMRDPKVIALLRRMAEFSLDNRHYSAQVIIVASKVVIPSELESFVALLDFPLPDEEEIRECIDNFAKEIKKDDGIKDKLVFSLKGLNRLQIRQVLSRASLERLNPNTDSIEAVRDEKEQIIKKSDVLEIINVKETLEDIGGLEKLKEWIKHKAEIFNHWDAAMKFKVDVPKGVLICGMPGCGKSLAAKATAAEFKVPLIRLDVGRLMGKYVGESEENMRRALKLAEAVSPCVLWIDELEKAFAGTGGEGDGGVTSRLFGHFLTWMQEREGRVFIVATANDISKLPPEFLRKGRFDERFFVDLPNEQERRQIFEIHLGKRGQLNEKIDIEKLVEKTEEKKQEGIGTIGINAKEYDEQIRKIVEDSRISSDPRRFSGADIEGVIKDAVEAAFIDFIARGEERNDETGNDVVVTTEMLEEIIKSKKSISDIQGDKIKDLREKLEDYDFKPASNSNEDEVIALKAKSTRCDATNTASAMLLSRFVSKKFFTKGAGNWKKGEEKEMKDELLVFLEFMNNLPPKRREEIKIICEELMIYTNTLSALKAVRWDDE